MDKNDTLSSEPVPTSSTSADDVKPTIYAWYVASVLTVTYVLAFIDRKLPFILVESIKHDLSLSDTQIGLLTGVVFTLVYAVAGIPIAALADRSPRKAIIGTAIFVWSVLTSAGGLATNFLQLAASRAGVAVGEAGSTPAAFSLISDYFSQRYRARAFGLYYAGAQVGILLGLALGGWLNDLTSWRTAMIIVGAPGVLLSLLIFTTVREPTRKSDANVPVVASTQSLSTGLKELLALPTYRNIFIAGVLFNCAGGGALSFGPAYVIREFHLTTAQTGLTYGLVTGGAGAIGAMMGGLIGDRLRRFDPRWPLRFVAGCLAIATPFTIAAFMMHSYWAFLALLFVPHLSHMMYAGSTFSAIQSIVRVRTRALASGVFLFGLNGVGLSLGSFLAGAISDRLSFLGHAASLRVAIIALSTLSMWGAVHYLRAASRLKADLALNTSA